MYEVFINPEAVFDRITIVTSDEVLVDMPGEDDLTALQTKLKETRDHLGLLKDPKIISLADVSYVQTNLYSHCLNVYCRRGGKKWSENIDFHDAEQRDLALRAIEKVLGPKFRSEEKQLSVIRSILMPIGWGAGLAFLTWVLASAAAQIAAGAEADTSGRNSFLKKTLVWVLDIMGPMTIYICGGLLVALCAGWLVARVRKPPLMYTLRKAA